MFNEASARSPFSATLFEPSRGCEVDRAGGVLQRGAIPKLLAGAPRALLRDADEDPAHGDPGAGALLQRGVAGPAGAAEEHGVPGLLRGSSLEEHDSI